MAYDNDNIFAKILRGELPNTTVYEDDSVLAFNDIAPKTPVHILVIPKRPNIDMDDFSANGSPEEIGSFFIKKPRSSHPWNILILSQCTISAGKDLSPIS